MASRDHPFWKFAAGEVPGPPCARLLGWTLVSGEPGSGTITVRFEAKPEFTNPIGSIQGGFLAAMLDDTMGPALVTTLEKDEFAPTLELKVSFIRPAKPGPVIGTGRVVHRGGTVAFLEGELRSAEGQLLATATATARIMRMDESQLSRA